MALSLSIADSANGNGGVATISGSSGGTVTVNRATATASAIGSYSSAGSRTGDGTVSLTGTGYFYWYASEGATTTSVTYQPLTANGDAIWDRCVTMVADRIKALNLPIIGSTYVYDKVLPDLDALMPRSTPVDYIVAVTATGERERMLGGPVGRDDIGYPCLIMLIHRVESDVETVRGRYYRARDRIERALTNQGYFDLRVPEVHNITTEPAPAIDTGQIAEDRVRLGLLTAVCVARRARGV